jgi:hypothetical protein
LEKKRGLKSTDKGKKLNYPFAKRKRSTKEKQQKRTLSGGKSKSNKLEVKTTRNEVKPPISPSNEFSVSSGSEEEDGQG